MPVSARMVVLAALVGLVALTAGCTGGPASRTSGGATGPVTQGRSTSPPANAQAPAARGRTACPGRHDRPFTLRHGRDRITGFSRGHGRRVAVLTHQFRGTPCDLAALGAALAADGYRTVAWTTATSPTPRTLRALVSHERDLGARQVVLVGASAGGATAAVGAGTIEPPVDALVVLSPADYAMSPGDVLRAVRRYRGPVLAVAGELDTAFASLPEQIGRAHRGPETVRVVPGSADHGRDFVTRRTDELVAEVLDFLDAHAPGR